MSPDDIDRTAVLGVDAADHLIAHDAGLVREVNDRPTRREMRKTALIAAVVVSSILSAVAILVGYNAGQEAAEAQQQVFQAEQDRKQYREAIDGSLRELRESNAELRRRGQQPVPEPDPQDITPQDATATAAAAKVLATLPDFSPSDQELGQAIARYIMTNPQGPSREMLAELVAAYLNDNPPQRGSEGPQGEIGEQGPPVTQEQILLAVQEVCSQQPGGTCEGPEGPEGQRGEKGEPGEPATKCEEGYTRTTVLIDHDDHVATPKRESLQCLKDE